MATTELTPMMQQFHDLKAKHPDALLLFRCGDFYETYNEDAVKVSEILGITLTKRSHVKDFEPHAMAGFPFHALDTYLPKLIRNGCRVAICDQLEDKKKTTKKRITELTTPNEQTINNMETTTATRQQFIGIAIETIKALNGKLPNTLNKRFADALGSLSFIRLKYDNNAKIETDEMDYIIRLAEIGLKQQEAASNK